MAKKARREKRGTGGIRRKNNKYEGTFVVHRANGTSIKKSFMRNTENEVRDIQARLRMLGVVEDNVEDISIDKYTNEVKLVYKGEQKCKAETKNDMLVKEYVDYYLFKYRKNGLTGKKIEDTTFSSYVDRGELIKRYLGNKKVAELTFDDIEGFINDLHKTISDTTVRQTRDIIIHMMKCAKKDGIITENVLQDEKINLKESKGKKEKKIIEKEDIGTFVNYCIENKHYDLIFALYTGVRASELAGVTWNNIDFENRTVKIEKAYMRIKKQEYVNGKKEKTTTTEFKDLKSKSSYRTIGLNSDMVKFLKIHKEEQKELAKKCNKNFKETDWVFTTKSYKGYLADYSSDKFRNVMNKIKIKNYEELTMHCLRHTFCSYGIMNNVRLEEMKLVLGHSNIRCNK